MTFFPHFRPLGTAVAVAAVLVLSACSTPGSDDQGSGQLTKVRFAANSSVGVTPSWIPLIVAEQLGFFEEEGLDVEALWPGNTGQAMQTLAAGQTDIAVTGPEAYFSATEQGQNIQLVYSWMRTPIYELALKKGSDINEWEDLDGKTIGVVALSAGGKLMTDVALEDAGLDPTSDVTYVAVGTGIAAYDALDRGRVDALSLWTAEYASMERIGAEMEYLPIESIEGLFSNSFVVSKPWIEGNEETIEGFGRAWAKATVWAQAHPKEALEMMWESAPESKIDAESDEERIDYQLSVFWEDNPENSANDYGSFSDEAVMRWIALGQRVGLLTGDLEAGEMYTSEFEDAFADFDHAEVESVSAD